MLVQDFRWASGKRTPPVNFGERMLEHRHPDLHLIRRVDLKHSRFRSLRDRKSVNLPIGYLRENGCWGVRSRGEIPFGSSLFSTGRSKIESLFDP